LFTIHPAMGARGGGCTAGPACGCPVRL